MDFVENILLIAITFLWSGSSAYAKYIDYLLFHICNTACDNAVIIISWVKKRRQMILTVCGAGSGDSYERCSVCEVMDQGWR